MQFFIKMPEPYYKTYVYTVNLNLTFKELKDMINEKTCYGNIKYYLISGRTVINDQHDNLTIKKYNELFPTKKITDEITLNLHIRNL